MGRGELPVPLLGCPALLYHLYLFEIEQFIVNLIIFYTYKTTHGRQVVGGKLGVNNYYSVYTNNWSGVGGSYSNTVKFPALPLLERT